LRQGLALVLVATTLLALAGLLTTLLATLLALLILAGLLAAFAALLSLLAALTVFVHVLVHVLVIVWHSQLLRKAAIIRPRLTTKGPIGCSDNVIGDKQR